ncbi:hypothetical protein PUNSTDRAFT_135448 [Punctularia strigosozonata HHB-11173 SS5]|uniref:uncharacterized protein n=1 Tax=Punctularia strigosozonata (strain HHB-11173) TaxID=741275 RepID=UPI0004417269|nr:uncharacterized protein PUNSTDRAFT_135448 [Punctularia strigosozonata HHB-11173 SS5]EIN07929.1 hypothetical protein PUNSTDRAFT_135448 [Punctularia strigosozonata HHB-11173 SS5]
MPWQGTKVRVYDDAAITWGTLSVDQIDDYYITFKISGQTWNITDVNARNHNPPIIIEGATAISETTLLTIPRVEEPLLGIPWWSWILARVKGLLNPEVPAGLYEGWAVEGHVV